MLLWQHLRTQKPVPYNARAPISVRANPEFRCRLARSTKRLEPSDTQSLALRVANCYANPRGVLSPTSDKDGTPGDRNIASDVNVMQWLRVEKATPPFRRFM